MPDGTVNDRDCGRATACCNPGASPGPAPQCANPGPGKNLNGCDFAGEDFSGQDLSGSSISDATFRNAELFDTDLSDTTMRRTTFRGANLCSANLSSSSLNRADFRGSTGPDGRPTNLTRANLRGSSCGGVLFNNQTIFCQTITCNGVGPQRRLPGRGRPRGRVLHRCRLRTRSHLPEPGVRARSGHMHGGAEHLPKPWWAQLWRSTTLSMPCHDKRSDFLRNGNAMQRLLQRRGLHRGDRARLRLCRFHRSPLFVS